MSRECPNCGSILTEGQTFCPACGTKVERVSGSERETNREFEGRLLSAENIAEVALTHKITEHINAISNVTWIDRAENTLLAVVEQFPGEARAYVAYVEFMMKVIDKVIADRYAFCDTNAIINRCRKYLETAKRIATDEELEKILETDSLINSKIEALSASGLNTEVKKWYKKEQRKGIGIVLIGAAIVLIFLIVMASLY